MLLCRLLCQDPDWWRWYETPPPLDTLRIIGAVHRVAGGDPDDNLYVLDWWRDQTASDVWIETLLDLMGSWKPVEWAEEKGQIEKSVGPFIDARMRERQVYCHREQFASSAASALADKTARRPVTCEDLGRDKYDRIIARCTVTCEDLGAWMVANGLALA